jgi:hypothetical protein
MPSHDREPIFSNDAEIIIVDDKVGEVDRTRRPASEASRKAMQKQLEKEAELRRLMEQIGSPGSTGDNIPQKGAPTSELEQRFDAAMLHIYRRAKSEAKYNATRYFQMLTDHGGLETARILLHANAVSDAYTALWERSRLDLIVEALIHDHVVSSFVHR